MPKYRLTKWLIPCGKPQRTWTTNTKKPQNWLSHSR
jgi:hypothetical protein